MKRVLSGLIGIVIAYSGHAQEASPLLESSQDKLNYAVGHQIGSDFRQHQVNVNDQAFLRGLHDAMSGTPPLLSQEERDKVLANFKHQVEAHHHPTSVVTTAQGEITQGRAFLSANAKKPDVQVREDGLQYKVVKSGTGKGSPKAGASVTINYTGSTITGRTFGTSRKNGQDVPEKYALEELVPGVQEALKSMKTGDHWQLFIPPELGFPRGKGPLEFRAIIFDVELVDFKNPG